MSIMHYFNNKFS